MAASPTSAQLRARPAQQQQHPHEPGPVISLTSPLSQRCVDQVARGTPPWQQQRQRYDDEEVVRPPPAYAPHLREQRSGPSTAGVPASRLRSPYAFSPLTTPPLHSAPHTATRPQQQQPHPCHHHHHHHSHQQQPHHARYRSALPVPPPLRSLEVAEPTPARTQQPGALSTQQPQPHASHPQPQRRTHVNPLLSPPPTAPVAAVPMRTRAPPLSVVALVGSRSTPVRETQPQLQQRGGRGRGQRRRGGRQHRAAQHTGAAATGAQHVMIASAVDVDLEDVTSTPTTPPNQRIPAMVLATQDTYNLDRSRHHRAADRDGAHDVHRPTYASSVQQGGGGGVKMATAAAATTAQHPTDGSRCGRIEDARAGGNPVPPPEPPLPQSVAELPCGDSPVCWCAMTSPATTMMGTSSAATAAAAAAAAAMARASCGLSRSFSGTDWKSPSVAGVHPYTSHYGVHSSLCTSTTSPPTHAHHGPPPPPPPQLSVTRWPPTATVAAPLMMAVGAPGRRSSSAGLSDGLDVGLTPSSTPARATHTPQQTCEQPPRYHNATAAAAAIALPLCQPHRHHFHVPSLSVTSLAAEDALVLYGQCSTPREVEPQADGAQADEFDDSVPAAMRAGRGGHAALVTPTTLGVTFETHLSAAGAPTRAAPAGAAAALDLHDDACTMPPSIASVSAATDTQEAGRTRPVYRTAATSAATHHGSRRVQRSIDVDMDVASDEDGVGSDPDVRTALRQATSSAHLHYRRDADFLFAVDAAETSQEVTPVAATRAHHYHYDHRTRHYAHHHSGARSRSADAERRADGSTGTATASAMGRSFMRAAAEAAIAAEAAAAAAAAAIDESPYNAARSFSASSSVVSRTAASSLYCSPQQLRTGGDGMPTNGYGSARTVAAMKGPPLQPLPAYPFTLAGVESRGGFVRGTGYTPPRFEAASPYTATTSPSPVSHRNLATGGGGGEGWHSPVQWDPRQARDDLEMEAARHVAQFALAQAAAAAAKEAGEVFGAAASVSAAAHSASPLTIRHRPSAPPSPLSATASFRVGASQRAASAFSCTVSAVAPSYPSGATESTMDVSRSVSAALTQAQHQRSAEDGALAASDEEDAEWLELLLHHRDRENENVRLRRLTTGPPTRTPAPTAAAAPVVGDGDARAVTATPAAAAPPSPSSPAALSWWATSRLMRHGMATAGDGGGSSSGSGDASPVADTRTQQQQQATVSSSSSPPAQLCAAMSTHAAARIISRQVRRHVWRLRERERRRVALSVTSRKPRAVGSMLVWAAA